MYKGQIKDFPEEVVEKMLYYQRKQGNPRDVSVFEKNVQKNKMGLGFTWNDTPEGRNFWEEVIDHKNFDLFFQKYPKQEKKIIGYICKDKQYNKTVAKIHGYKIVGEANAHEIPFMFGERSIHGTSHDVCIKEFEEFGVLDIMFNPIYEEKKLVNPFKVGDKVVLVPEKIQSSFCDQAPDFTKECNLGNAVLEISSFSDNWRKFGYVYLKFNNHELRHPYDCFRLATEEEILEDYVKKHYPKGTKIRSAYDKNKVKVINGKFRFPNKKCITASIDGTADEIYIKHGNKWAEIIKEPTININGCTGVFGVDTISFGCAYIDYTTILKLYDVIKHSNDLLKIISLKDGEVETVIVKPITSITIGKGTFTSAQIIEMAEHIKTLKP